MLSNLKSSGRLAALLLALVTPAVAQVFVGSDNFDGGASSKWDLVYNLNGATDGSLAFANSRLDYTTSVDGLGTPTHANQFRLWNSDGTVDPLVTPTSFTTSWVMQLTVTNTLASGVLSPGDFANIGIQVFNDAEEYHALMLGSTSDGFNIRSEGNGMVAITTTPGANTNVVLQLSWDAGSQILSSAYSLDGSSFTSVSTFNPVTGWSNASPSTEVSNGFNFGVFGTSTLTNGTIASGVVYADNFSVSAVPEPSTYAAIAGLGALGLAFWRKRRSRAG